MRRLAPLLLLLAIGANATPVQQTSDPLARYIYPLAKPLPAPAVEIDVTDMPSAKAWAEKAKLLVETWYPQVTALLATEDYKSPKTIRLVVKKKIAAPAWASGNEITFNGEWITAHPDDLGIVVHEMTHVIQAYPGADTTPGWLVEGIADYVRWWRYEPEAPRTPVNPDKASYRDAYRTTANFLAWVTAKYDRRIVPTLDRACRKRIDPLPEFTRLIGKDIDTVWAEYIATLRK